LRYLCLDIFLRRFLMSEPIGKPLREGEDPVNGGGCRVLGQTGSGSGRWADSLRRAAWLQFEANVLHRGGCVASAYAGYRVGWVESVT
jgi:hypothetical protein